MAIIQVAAIVFATRAARQVGDVMHRFERDVKPIVANLQVVSSEAARVSSAAAAQVQRAEQLMSDLTRRVDETAAALQSGIIGRASSLPLASSATAADAPRPANVPPPKKRTRSLSGKSAHLRCHPD
jgi:alkylated DNA nucleotide flippase Atl1